MTIHDRQLAPRPLETSETSVSPPAFRVLLTCDFFEPGFRAGGPIRSIAQTLDVVSTSIEVTMVTRDRDLGSSEPYPGLSGRWVQRGRTRIFYLDPGRLWHWLTLARELRSTRFDLLYVNSLWAASSILPILAARIRLIQTRRILIAPRGELAQSALNANAGRKRMFLRVWRPFLRWSKALWHATNPDEADQIRRTFHWAHVETRQNSVSLPSQPMPPVVPGEPLRLVFIGRINPIKNLSIAIAALASMTRPAIFDIYGPPEDTAYWSMCRRLAREVPDTVTVTYRGELRPEQVRPTFARYDAFVFPTQGENFGHVIAESLSASCPVICSDRTPWSAVLRAGGGAVLADLTPAALARELDRLAHTPAAERLSARHAAGEAYRSWHASTSEANILDQVRLAVREH